MLIQLEMLLGPVATSLYYVHYSRAKEGITDLVLAESICVQCLIDLAKNVLESDSHAYIGYN